MSGAKVTFVRRSRWRDQWLCLECRTLTDDMRGHTRWHAGIPQNPSDFTGEPGAGPVRETVEVFQPEGQQS